MTNTFSCTWNLKYNIYSLIEIFRWIKYWLLHVKLLENKRRCTAATRLQAEENDVEVGYRTFLVVARKPPTAWIQTLLISDCKIYIEYSITQLHTDWVMSESWYIALSILMLGGLAGAVPKKSCIVQPCHILGRLVGIHTPEYTRIVIGIFRIFGEHWTVHFPNMSQNLGHIQRTYIRGTFQVDFQSEYGKLYFRTIAEYGLNIWGDVPCGIFRFDTLLTKNPANICIILLNI